MAEVTCAPWATWAPRAFVKALAYYMTCPTQLVGGCIKHFHGVHIALAHGRNQIIALTCNFKRNLFPSPRGGGPRGYPSPLTMDVGDCSLPSPLTSTTYQLSRHLLTRCSSSKKVHFDAMCLPKAKLAFPEYSRDKHVALLAFPK